MSVLISSGSPLASCFSASSCTLPDIQLPSRLHSSSCPAFFLVCFVQLALLIAACLTAQEGRDALNLAIINLGSYESSFAKKDGDKDKDKEKGKEKEHQKCVDFLMNECKMDIKREIPVQFASLLSFQRPVPALSFEPDPASECTLVGSTLPLCFCMRLVLLTLSTILCAHLFWVCPFARTARRTCTLRATRERFRW